VILTTAQLAPFRGAVAMVDGGFDPLHPGHVAYFREAARLGAPVLCNLAPDAWVARKHRPLLTQAERAVVVDAIRHVDLVHPASGSTEDVLRALAPRFYVKGADWRGRLPAEQLEICAAQGTEVVFLDTVTGSSTALLERFRA
jgi:D-beta-D-heptose 7-phosphate kinase/D-beta-D-heptose 1-phosphate adenosyltransferase